jgi:hypothetical protein
MFLGFARKSWIFEDLKRRDGAAGLATWPGNDGKTPKGALLSA